MIQDIPAGSYDNSYFVKDPEPDSPVYAFRGNEYLGAAGTALLPAHAQLGGACRFLFRAAGRDRFLSLEPAREIPGFCFRPIGDFRTLAPREEAFSLITAYHLYNWYRTNRYCGACGTPYEPGTKERSLVCPACGDTRYPVISPCVIVGVTDGDRIVLTRYRGRGGKPSALVAGFCEIGESLEESARREVMEETGLSIGQLRYYKSQPWGMSSSLLSGFFAKLEGPDAIRVQEDELDAAVWVRRADIDVPDDGVALTREMIARFARGDVWD